MIKPSSGLLTLLGALLVLAADQWWKSKAIKHELSAAWLKCVPHRRAIYESTIGRMMLVAFWFLAIASVLAVLRSGEGLRSVESRAGVGFALGGAASNLTDILRYRYVVNYIHLHWWPIFNLADAAIVVGVTAAIFC